MTNGAARLDNLVLPVSLASSAWFLIMSVGLSRSQTSPTLRAKLHYTDTGYTTPPTDTTNGRPHNNSTTNLPHRNARAQHFDMSTQDVGMWQIFVRWW